jgi:hypothetical protein
MRETDQERREREERIHQKIQEIAEHERDRINREERQRIEEERKRNDKRSW